MNFIFPYIFSHFAIPPLSSELEGFEESTRAFLVLSSRADEHLPTVADCPHHGQGSQLDVGKSSQFDARLRSHELQHFSFPDGSDRIFTFHRSTPNAH